MSCHLTREIAALASESRRSQVCDLQIIKELTMIVGYAHMFETHPDLMNYSEAIRKHLEAFADLTCSGDHHELCRRSWRILGILDGGDLKDVA
jgi:hypothetical protein